LPGNVEETGDLNDPITDTAAALAQVLPNPGNWPGWLVILLHELECQTGSPQKYRQAMALLVEVIEARLDAGKWPPVI
jgi:hypothetical protein